MSSHPSPGSHLPSPDPSPVPVPGGLSLQTLFTHLRASSSLQLRSPEPTSQGASHSAGYDAYVTAAVFLMVTDRGRVLGVEQVERGANLQRTRKLGALA